MPQLDPTKEQKFIEMIKRMPRKARLKYQKKYGYKFIGLNTPHAKPDNKS